MVSLGKVYIGVIARGQKLNSRLWKESDIVGVYDNLPQVLWARYFTKYQGCVIKYSIFYQDNKSAILLYNNVKG